MADDFDDDLETSLYNQWLNFSTSGQWDRARDTLGELLTREPDSAWLHCQMGFALYRLDENKQSEIHFKKSIGLDPDNAEAFQGLSYLYFSMNRAGSAEDHCRKALQLDPDDIDNWVLMTHLCVHFDDANQAATCLKKAEAINADDFRIISLRTQVGAISKGSSKLSPEEQLTGYRESLRQNPENETTHYRIGYLQLEELRDYAGAEASFREALRLDPQDKANQKALMSVLRRRDPVLRVLWSPFNFGMWIFKVFSKAWDMIWPIIFLIFAWKWFVIFGVALWLIFFCLFWPLAKVYESLTLVEVHKKMGMISLYRGPMRHIHRLSFPIRLGIFSLIFIAFWSLMVFLWKIDGARSKIISGGVFLIMGGVFLFMGLGLLVWIRDGFRDWRRRKKNSSLK